MNYYIPKDLKDALRALHENRFLPYAGGTDINPAGIDNRDLLFIGKLPELKEIRSDGEYICVGSAVTFSEAYESALIPGIMKAAIREIAGPAVRNIGTLGGNLANGSGKADSALIDIVLDAKLHIQSFDHDRYVKAEDFYKGRKKIDLAGDELITEILIPDKEHYINYFYEKISVRSSLAISNVTVASVWKILDNRVESLAIGIGSAMDYPQRCRDVENELIGKTLEEIEAEGDAILGRYTSGLELPPDRTSIDYRRQVCFRLLEYLIREEFTPIRM